MVRRDAAQTVTRAAPGPTVSAKALRMLAVVATDRTFEPTTLDGRRAWVGKCLFCGRRLVIRDDGAPASHATLEHIWPRNHGGTDDVANLALACGGCNREKGSRHDARRRDDPRLLEVVAALRARRAERWRAPLAALAGRIAPVMTAAGDDDA